MSTKNWTLYIHTNKSNGKKYIGITSKKPEDRWKNGTGYKRQFFGRAVAKYGWDGFEHEIITTDTEDVIKHLEMYYIRNYKTYDREFGYNISMGGDGSILPPDELKRIRKERGKKVYQYTMEGECVRTFDSIRSVSEHDFNPKSVKKCFKGKSNSHRGFLWSNTELTKGQALELADKARVRDSIYQYDTYGKLVRVLDKCVDFVEYGFNFRCVSACATGTNTLHQGYVFSNRELTEDEVKERFKKVYGEDYRTVYRYDFKGVVVDSDIIKQYGLKGYNVTDIKKCCNGERVWYKQCIWSYDRLTEEELADKLSKAKLKAYDQVFQYSLNGELVAVKESLGAFAKDGLYSAYIKKQCEKGYGAYNGYVWSYTELTLEQVQDAVSQIQTKKYFQYSTDGVLLHSTTKLQDYADMGFDYENVRNACNRNCGYHNGYIWSIEELTMENITRHLEWIEKTRKKDDIFFQYSKDGDLVKVHSSRAELKKDGFDVTNVVKCCGNDSKVKSVKGYVFSSTELTKEEVCKRAEKSGRGHGGIKTYQYDLQGNLIDVKNSASEYAKKGFNANAIGACCNGKRKTHGGYRWSYTELHEEERMAS